MATAIRSAAKLLLVATAAAGWALGVAATPAAAEPVDPDFTGPPVDGSEVLPVVGVIDGMWREYVPPNAVPPGPTGQINQLIEQFVPTTTQVRDFFAFIQQFRSPETIAP